LQRSVSAPAGKLGSANAAAKQTWQKAFIFGSRQVPD
jgi:hypothetical protein